MVYNILLTVRYVKSTSANVRFSASVEKAKLKPINSHFAKRYAISRNSSHVVAERERMQSGHDDTVFNFTNRKNSYITVKPKFLVTHFSFDSRVT